MNINDYIASLNHHLSLGDSTEHTHRPALKSLIESIASGITATNEPKRRTDCGAPDFIVTKGQVPLGYIEAKDIGISLDAAEETDQLARYRDSLGNLILTDYLEFRWYVRPRAKKPDEYPTAEHRMTARLATVSKDGKVRVDKDGEKQVVELLNGFITARVPTVRSAKELAVRMAALAGLIRDITYEALAGEESEGALHQQMEGFREVLIHDLNPPEFSDMYAQTICYGLFTARVNKKGSERFTREHAWSDLPKTNPFLRKMFNHIAGPDLDDRIAWAVDDLAELLNVSRMNDILADFGKSTKQEDPVVHFYETFLAAYDPQMRELRGVYYTPEPVVSYIVRSIDYILKTEFKLADGLADSTKIKIKSPDGRGKAEVHKVLILDPATGTGTFLYEVIKQIYSSFRHNLGMWSGYVSEHLLPRLFGFELLMAPYAVAHMKLGLVLSDSGYDFKADERLRVYLTNTLEEAHEVSKLPLFTHWLAEEANEASKIKQEAPVMVVLGNPPYSISSQNKGDWISNLIEDYKKNLKEKKLNLDDDFIKFIKFAQWRIEKTGYGILAFISNNAYLDGLTHRRMRESLMQTFDDIYILDLHGNSNKKEHCPDGSKDENVFDIRQGVAIGIFVKKKAGATKAIVRHSDLWGLREAKYKRLLATDVSNVAWAQLNDIERSSCLGTFRFFTPKAFDNIDEYCEGWSVKDIFQISANAIKTDRDDLFYDYGAEPLEKRMRVFYSEEGLAPAFRDQYRVEDSSSYALLSRRRSTSFDVNAIFQCLYRPYDVRYLYYAPGLTSRPAWEVMQHMVGESNLGLITTRQTSDSWDCLVTDLLCGHKSCAAYDINSLFPLYVRSDPADKNLFEDPTSDGVRRPNLTPDFIAHILNQLGIAYAPDGKTDGKRIFGPKQVFDYMYAVFHSPTYRSRYEEFLKIDFPRLPLTSNVALFRQLCALGLELVALHLMKKHAPNKTAYPIAGANEVEKVRYTAPGEAGSDKGRVWINKTQYIEGVAPDTWNFHVGGYQPAQKWLKDRKGRKLSYDDLTHYQHIISALNETIRLMSEIDDTIEQHGGWPIR